MSVKRFVIMITFYIRYFVICCKLFKFIVSLNSEAFEFIPQWLGVCCGLSWCLTIIIAQRKFRSRMSSNSLPCWNYNKCFEIQFEVGVFLSCADFFWSDWWFWCVWWPTETEPFIFQHFEFNASNNSANREIMSLGNMPKRSTTLMSYQ